MTKYARDLHETVDMYREADERDRYAGRAHTHTHMYYTIVRTNVCRRAAAIAHGCSQHPTIQPHARSVSVVRTDERTCAFHVMSCHVM
jgi:hypothetical protein